MKPNSRRLRRLVVTEEMLQAILGPSQDQVSRTRGLPQDARFVGLTHDPQADCVWAFVESAQFAPVRIGQIPPVLEMTVETAAFGKAQPPTLTLDSMLFLRGLLGTTPVWQL